ncbi:precorrin-8X methylmutase [Methanocella conradii]|uniref:precorrin-8X methylmutase n=1 Tax=Methanocella conradii TaxID=1175444 RepID=UPI0032047A03
MGRESSLPEGITESMSIEPGARTRESLEIARKSRAIARKAIGDSCVEDRIRQRCSIAVGDFAMAGLLRFVNGPVEAGLEALKACAPIYTDIRMVQAGIISAHHSKVYCALDFGLDMAVGRGITRTSAGFLSLGKRLEGSIVVIGNAPSALLSVCDMVRHGIRPGLIIGVPVGFVNAADSKALLRTLDVPSISTEGTRGGTPVAVAALNEIIIMYGEACHDKGPCDRL